MIPEAVTPDDVWEPSSRLVVANLVGFQLGWWACVLGAAEGYPIAGPLVVACLLALHLLLVPSRSSEIRLAIEVVLLGLAIDSTLSAAGLLEFVYSPGWVAPPWILAMWLNFALVLRVSLRWLHGRFILASCSGALGGPAAYWAGERLQAVTFGASPAVVLGVLGITWALVVPFLIYRSREVRHVEPV